MLSIFWRKHMIKDFVKYNKEHSREKHWNWKGGRTITPEGYVLTHMPEHPKSKPNGYIYEHRLIMEKKIGRYLHRWEIVHHIDGNRQNNKPENLKLVRGNSQHKKLHPNAGIETRFTTSKMLEYWKDKKIKVN